jgi:acetylglutamate kinase
MQAKLNAATDALHNGIGQVIIAPGAMANAAERILSGEAIGTRLIAEGAVHA